MRDKKKLFVGICILVIICGLVLRQTLQSFNFEISGLDYIIWFGFFIISLFYALIGRNLSLPNKYFILILFLLFFIVVNFFTSIYVTSISSYLIGSIITFIFPITFITSYSLSISKTHILYFVRTLLAYVTILLVILFVERIINGSYFTSNRIESKIIKAYGFIGTIASLNVVFALFLLLLTKKRNILIPLIFSVFMIIHLVMLKSIVSLLLISIVFYFLFYRINLNRLLKIGLLTILALALLIAISDNIQKKINKYIHEYVTSKTYVTPRIRLYQEAFNIANDNFPFGSGQGTYGSFPVMKNYSKVYIDYGLSKTNGLIFKQKPNFLFDSHWSSVIGELGYIAGAIYLILFLFPMIVALKYRKNEALKPYVFLISASIIVILNESIALAIPYQISFIMIYAGLTGLVLRYIKNIVAN